MGIATKLQQIGFRTAAAVSGLWIRPSVLPESPATMQGAGGRRICYVLAEGGLADRLALYHVCRRRELHQPAAPFTYAGTEIEDSLVRLRRYRGIFVRRQDPELSERLRRLSELAQTTDDNEICFIPVAIYWGRSPDKERGFFKLAFSERWELVGRTRKLFTSFLQGRSTLVQFSEPLLFSDILKDGLEPERCARKVSRILRVHFRHRRIASLGPDLSHRRLLVDRILHDPQVITAIENRASRKSLSVAEARKAARRYALEVAADASYPTVRILARLLGRVWNRLYDGIRLHGLERLKAVVDGNEIIYVPCHRSHMDYLLLSYIIYNQGLSIPHIAAGINLNLPVVGSLLRRGGAFFLRRSFKGNRLYAAVFHAYLRHIQSAGFSLEYFIEGGRSRTGRLLEPKGGMLSMSVISHLHDPVRPVYFVPVYLGYEKMIEARSFIGELSGGKKEKESLFALLRSLKKLREDFGQVYVNFGEPIALAETLDNYDPDWKQDRPDDVDTRPEWMPEMIDELGENIMQSINASAVVTPISLIATALLGTPKQTMSEDDLIRQIEFSLILLTEISYSPTVVLPRESPQEMIGHALKLGLIRRDEHPMGDLLHMPETEAIMATYFRNNTLHLIAVHASVACAFLNGHRISMQELQSLVRLSYRYVAAELTMPKADENLAQKIEASVTALLRHGLLHSDDGGKTLTAATGGTTGAFLLQVLGASLIPVLQRYYLTIALLVSYGQGELSASGLEKACELAAQRLAMTYGLRSPDFFDRRLFQLFIRGLREQGIIWPGDDRNLHFADNLERIQTDARRMLGEQIHHSILSVTTSMHTQTAAEVSEQP